MNKFIQYKSKVASRYIPVEPVQITQKIMESEYYLASIKLDGHLTFLSVKNGEAQLFDRSGKPLHIPNILTLASSLKDNIILAGELCCFKNDVSTSHMAVSAALDEANHHDLRFAAFDIVEYNDLKNDLDPRETSAQLEALLTGFKEIFPVKQTLHTSRKELHDFYQTAKQDGAEGIIVRIPNGITYKVKEKLSLDLVVLGYAESVGDRQGWLRELLLGFALDDTTFQVVTKCGSGFSDQERKELPVRLSKLSVQSEYTQVSGAKTAFIFIKPEIVVEISCLDLINETSIGAIKKTSLIFDDAGYSLHEMNSTLSIISPNFIRIRTDKQANALDAGVRQAYDLVPPIEREEKTSPEIDSQITFREVYIKRAPSGAAIRKFIGLKTNKEDSGLYAPYLVVYTDYSPSRKTPLEQELYLCAHEVEMMEKLNNLKEENIKKGWEVFTT
jgi:ATP-dependent DNA ligase